MGRLLNDIKCRILQSSEKHKFSQSSKNISFLLTEIHIRGTLIFAENEGRKQPEPVKISSCRLGHIFYP